MSSYYRKVTTYRNDFNQGQAPGYDRSDDLMKRIDYSRPPKFNDPSWQRGRNESSDQYEQRMQEMSRNMKPDYYRTYEERRPEDYHGGHEEKHYQSDGYEQRRHEYERRQEHDRRNEQERRHEHERRQEHERRLEHERRNEIGHGYPDGSQTERGGYHNDSFYDRGNLTYRRQDKIYDPKKKDLYQYKDYVNNRAMADYVIVEKEYDRYRPTQKDYGSFDTAPRIDDMPRPYRGQFDKQLDAFQNKVREQNLSYDTSAHPVPHPHIEYKPTGNLELPSQPESGVYMLIRANATDLDEVKKSFQKHKTILKMSGHLTGIATADQVQVDGDYTNWTQRSAILMVLWFPSAKAAENWMVYDSDFKIASFPYPNGADIVIVPVNYIPPNDDRCTTFVMTEYPDVKNPEYFRTGIIEPMRDILRDYNCEPFVVRTNGVSVERGCWISPKSLVTVHRFADSREAQRFQKDSRVSMLKGKLNGVTRGGRYTTLRFTLNFLV